MYGAKATTSDLLLDDVLVDAMHGSIVGAAIL
jgi:hypothetical protein